MHEYATSLFGGARGDGIYDGLYRFQGEREISNTSFASDQLRTWISVESMDSRLAISWIDKTDGDRGLGSRLTVCPCPDH